MVQEDILNLLKDCREALSVSEITDKLTTKVNSSAITRALKQLSKYGEVEAIQIDVRIARRIYGKRAKHGMRLFAICN